MEYTKLAKTQTRRGMGEIAVMGVGNLLLGDEGVGIHLVRKLADLIHYENVKIIDAGTCSDFMSLLDKTPDKLIVVDAVKTDEKPGTVYRFDINDVDLQAQPIFSSHDTSVSDSLRTMALLGTKPKSVVIIGVEPGVIDSSLDLSPEVETALPAVIDLVIEEIRKSTEAEK